MHAGTASPEETAIDAQSALSGLTPDAAPAAMLATEGARGHVLFASPAFGELWPGPEPSDTEEVRERLRESAADPAMFDAFWRRHFAVAQGETQASLLALRDGRRLHWRTVRLSGPAGEDRGEIHLFDAPLSARPGAEQPVDDSLFRLTFDKAAVGMTLISPELRFVRANPYFCRMLGYDERDIRGRAVAEVIVPDGPLEGEMERALADALETIHVEQRFVHQDGRPVWVALSLSLVKSAAGQPVYFIALAEDATERKQEEAERARRARELQAMAMVDALTGLYNHRLMQETLGRLLLEAARGREPVSIVMLDVDSFREVNARHGHDAGDRVLQCVAQCLRHALREYDVACRYGGDEMVVILQRTPLSAALAVAERVRRRLETLRPVAGAEPTTCSIGVATFPDHASTAASLLKAADVAMYAAKRAGKNRVSAYVRPAEGGFPDHLDVLRAGLQGASLEAVNALVTAVDLRDRYTGAHCQRVGRLSVDLAVRLGCSEEEIEILRLGAPLLDVGKIGLPDYLLTKTGALTRSEWELMHRHPVWGEELIRRTVLPPETARLIRGHHERLDGSGYPDGQAGEELCRLTRIVGLADVATALREDRPHRRAWPRERVQAYLRRHAGTKLDPDVVDAYDELAAPR